MPLRGGLHWGGQEAGETCVLTMVAYKNERAVLFQGYETPLAEYRPEVGWFSFWVPSAALSLAVFVNVSPSPRGTALPALEERAEADHFAGQGNVHFAWESRAFACFLSPAGDNASSRKGPPGNLRKRR